MTTYLWADTHVKPIFLNIKRQYAISNYICWSYILFAPSLDNLSTHTSWILFNFHSLSSLSEQRSKEFITTPYSGRKPSRMTSEPKRNSRLDWYQHTWITNSAVSHCMSALKSKRNSSATTYAVQCVPGISSF
jgi:hypothetical protein